MFFLMPDTSRLDYYTYGSFNGTPSSANSGFFASITGINAACDFSYLDLSGCNLRRRVYGRIYSDDYPPGAPSQDFTSISQYNSNIFSGILISPKHVLVAAHISEWFSGANFGYGTNVLGFMNTKGEIVTQAFNPTPIAGPSDWDGKDYDLYQLTSAITDPDVKIYNKVIDVSGSDTLEAGLVTHTISSNGQVQPAYILGSGSVNFSGAVAPVDDIYNNAIVFGGDSSSPVFLYHPTHGTVYCGSINNSTDYPKFRHGIHLIRAGLNQALEDNGGYSLTWLTKNDFVDGYKIKDALIMSTEDTYTPSTNMNSKEILCEVTAIRGDDTTKKTHTDFAAISGSAPPDIDFDGNYIKSTTFLYNSFYEGTQLLWTVDADDAYTNTFPPVTAFSDIIFGPTLNNSGISGSVLAQSGTNFAMNIPDGVAGLSMNASFWVQNIFGQTGDSLKYYPMGTTLIQSRGFGPTFDSFAFNDTSPSPGDTITGTFSGLTLMPDRGNNFVQAVGIGFSYSPATANFSGSSFTITIPAAAEAGDTLLVIKAAVTNAYGQVDGTVSQSITIA